MIRVILIAALFVCISAANETREPSEFRFFSDKQKQKIEARILSISEDGKTLALEKKGGAAYEIAVTVLSLDDQQFVRDWLNPKPSETVLEGKIDVFGVLPGGKEIDVAALEEITKFKSIHAVKFGWIVLLPDGGVVDFVGRYADLGEIKQVTANTVWIAMTNAEGSFLNGSGNRIHPEISTAVQCVAGSGNSAALLADGTVKIFGRSFDREDSFDPPGELAGIVSLASTQGSMAAVAADGSVHCWSKKLEPVSGIPGTGAVEIQGSIFNFLVLTREGEVYQWGGTSIDKAKIPSALDPDETYIQVRANGNTFAAQREDGHWTAWGMNGAGIVDHINSLGPVDDIAFFSEPGKNDHGYVIWLEKE